jgi:hypothetical protein
MRFIVLESTNKKNGGIYHLQGMTAPLPQDDRMECVRGTSEIIIKHDESPKPEQANSRIQCTGTQARPLCKFLCGKFCTGSPVLS